MYGKFFASTFTGSMYGSGPDVFAVWGYVIANAVDSQVELNPLMLAATIGTTPERIAEAIEVLCAPDPRSRSKGNEGRRLIREGEYAYHVPNFLAYRSIRNEEDRRAYNREKQREHRERVKHSVNDSQSLSTLSAKAETEAEAETEATNAAHTLAPFFVHAEHASAYLGLRALAKTPLAFDGMLKTIHTPPTGGPSYSWDMVGQALLDMQANGSTVTSQGVRAFCRKLTQPEPSNGKRPNKITEGRANLSAWVERSEHGN